MPAGRVSDVPQPTQPVGSKGKTRHQIFYSFPLTPSTPTITEYLLQHSHCGEATASEAVFFGHLCSHIYSLTTHWRLWLTAEFGPLDTNQQLSVIQNLFCWNLATRLNRSFSHSSSLFSPSIALISFSKAPVETVKNSTQGNEDSIYIAWRELFPYKLISKKDLGILTKTTSLKLSHIPPNTHS